MWTIHTPLTLLDYIIAVVIGLIILTLGVVATAYFRQARAQAAALAGQRAYVEKLTKVLIATKNVLDAQQRELSVLQADNTEMQNDFLEFDRICEQHLEELTKYQTAFNVVMRTLQSPVLQMGTDSEGTN